MVQAHYGSDQRQQGQGEPQELQRSRHRTRLASVLSHWARGLRVEGLGFGVRFARDPGQEGTAGRTKPVLPRAVDF